MAQEPPAPLSPTVQVDRMPPGTDAAKLSGTDDRGGGLTGSYVSGSPWRPTGVRAPAGP